MKMLCDDRRRLVVIDFDGGCEEDLKAEIVVMDALIRLLENNPMREQIRPMRGAKGTVRLSGLPPCVYNEMRGWPREL